MKPVKSRMRELSSCHYYKILDLFFKRGWRCQWNPLNCSFSSTLWVTCVRSTQIRSIYSFIHWSNPTLIWLKLAGHRKISWVGWIWPKFSLKYLAHFVNLLGILTIEPNLGVKKSNQTLNYRVKFILGWQVGSGNATPSLVREEQWTFFYCNNIAFHFVILGISFWVEI